MAARRIPRDARVCYIYIVEAAGLLKVGWSDNPAQRIQSLQVGSPFPLRLVHSFPCPSYEAMAIETAAHRALADRHVRGEWHDAEVMDVVAAVHAAFAARGVKVLTLAEVGRELAKRYLAKARTGTPIQQAIAKEQVSGLI
jgi:hypothetical protein